MLMHNSPPSFVAGTLHDAARPGTACALPYRIPVESDKIAATSTCIQTNVACQTLAQSALGVGRCSCQHLAAPAPQASLALAQSCRRAVALDSTSMAL